MLPGLRTIGARLRVVGDALASVVFPAPCRICGQILARASRVPICSSCLASIQPLTDPMCSRCGRPFVSPVAAQNVPLPLCHMCRRGLYDFEFARSAAPYTAATVGAVVLLKYHEVVPLGGWFANRLRDLAAQHPELGPLDAVVPVPQHPARLRERGYNQAELIARPLSRRLGLPYRSFLLVRTRPRPEKLKLTVRERWRTVRGAYAIREGIRVDNLRVLLVDDVFTTGATLDACSRALRRAGASRVVALTMARAVLRGEIPGGKVPLEEPYE